MSSIEASPALGKTDEERVRQFLSAYPDFFARNPDLVERLIVPHPCGSAHSLIEHQVALLRIRNRKLQRRLRELIENARDNEARHARVHRLGLQLLHCRSAGELLDTLYATLRAEFKVEFASVRARVEEAARVRVARQEFLVEPSLALAKLFELQECFCGPLTEVMKRELFGFSKALAADLPVSGVVVPLLVDGPVRLQGLLGIGVSDRHRFRRSMGTLFFQQLGELFSVALALLILGEEEDAGALPAGEGLGERG